MHPTETSAEASSDRDTIEIASSIVTLPVSWWNAIFRMSENVPIADVSGLTLLGYTQK